MDNSLFDQLSFARMVTLHTIKDINEKEAGIVPAGFNNNILWNLGHVYMVQERFAFVFAGEKAEIPEEFPELFGMGTKPADWTTQPPALDTLIKLLTEQPARIRGRLENRLNETVANPFSIPGLTLKTFGELLSFNLYHKGVHTRLSGLCLD